MSYHFCFSLVVAGRWKVQVLLWVHRRLALWRQCELQGRQLNWRVERMMTTQSAKASQTARVWSVRRRLQDLRQDPSPLMNSHRRMQHLFWPDSQGLRSTSFFDVCWSFVYSLFILLKWWRSVRVRGRLGQMALAWLSLTSDLVFQGGTPPRQGTHDSRAVSFMATMAVSCAIQVKTNCLRHTANSSSGNHGCLFHAKRLRLESAPFSYSLLLFLPSGNDISPDKSQVACVCKALWPTSCIAWCLPGAQKWIFDTAPSYAVCLKWM